MQNISVPSQASVLNNNAASAAAAKTAQQANAANDGPAFKEVLAKQAKTETKQAEGTEQTLQRKRMLLQLKLGDEVQQAGVNPKLMSAELAAEQALKPADVATVVEGEAVPTKDAALLVADQVPAPADGQAVLAAVAADVQRRPAVEVAEELDKLDAQRSRTPVDWSAGKEQLTDAALGLDKAAMQTAAAVAAAKSAANNDQSSSSFTDALDQVQQLQANVTAAAPQVQQAQQAAVAVDVRSNQVATPFGQPGWNQAIGQKVVWMAAGGEQTASLTLNPPDLGPLQVVIHVHNNQADTTFLSDQADVRRALEDGMDNLRQMMSESGLQLGQANVRSGQQEAQQQFTGMGGSSNAGQQGGEADTVLAKAAKVMGLVDTFV